MTDNRTTEPCKKRGWSAKTASMMEGLVDDGRYGQTTELREKLTERGVRFVTDDSAASKVTVWTTQNGDRMFDCDYTEPLNEKPGTIGAKTELIIYGYTPEQAIAATLGSGKLTAEQVREAIMSADRWEKPMGDTGMANTHLIIRDDGWQGIADELNSRAERTCHIVKNSRKYVLSDGRELFEDGCSICNGYVGDGDNYCSNCGARVVDE